MRRIGTGLAAAFALAAAAPARAACPGADLMPTKANVAKVRGATLCLLNVQRRAHGLTKLTANTKLRHAATAFSKLMVRDDFFDHTSPSGSTPESRIRATGYLDGARSWSIGENIAWGSGSYAPARSIVRSWMHSPGHRANILNGGFREIGIGIAIGAPQRGPGTAGAATYTTDFGSRG